jgi:hypothetical protein
MYRQKLNYLPPKHAPAMMMGVDSFLDPDSAAGGGLLLLLLGAFVEGVGLLGGREADDRTLTSAVVTGGEDNMIVVLARMCICLSAASKVGLRETPSGLMLVLAAVAAAGEVRPAKQGDTRWGGVAHIGQIRPLCASCFAGMHGLPEVHGNATAICTRVCLAACVTICLQQDVLSVT